MERWVAAFLIAQQVLVCGCERVTTFDTRIAGFEEKTSEQVPSLVGLKLDPPMHDGKFVVIRYEPCQAEPCTLAATTLTEIEKGIPRPIQIAGGNGALDARDLRIGQLVEANYARRGDLEPQTLTIREYAPPGKFLRLALTIYIDDGLKEQYQTEALKSLVTTHLSWRLPEDVAFVRDDDETIDVGRIIGRVEVLYSIHYESTPWMLRNLKRVEVLNIATQMWHDRTSNWDKLKAMGGNEPEGHRAGEYSYKSAFMNVPIFQVSH